jgi:hypothetical protein
LLVVVRTTLAKASIFDANQLLSPLLTIPIGYPHQNLSSAEGGCRELFLSQAILPQELKSFRIGSVDKGLPSFTGGVDSIANEDR